MDLKPENQLQDHEGSVPNIPNKKVAQDPSQNPGYACMVTPVPL